jgi:hypothetical protein
MSSPVQRRDAVAPLLDRLTSLAGRVAESDERHRGHTSHEVARTHTDVLLWVAQGPWNGDAEPPEVAVALKDAFAVCESQQDRDFYLEFCWAECARGLDPESVRTAYTKVTRKLVEESGKHRETRHEAELEHVGAICHARLGEMALEVHQADLERGRAEAAARKALEAARALGRGGVTVFSALRRHNVNAEEFAVDVGALVAPPDSKASPGSESS